MLGTILIVVLIRSCSADREKKAMESPCKDRNEAKKTIHNSMDDIRDHAGGMTGASATSAKAVKDVFIEKLTDMLRRAVSLGDRGQQAVRDAAAEVRDDHRGEDPGPALQGRPHCSGRRPDPRVPAAPAIVAA